MHNKRFLVKKRVSHNIIRVITQEAKMNTIIKMLIKNAIQNNILVHTSVPMGEKYSIKNQQGIEILSVINGWATNYYSISVNNQNVLSVKWDESAGKPLTNDQKDMVDIINACKEKIDLQETAHSMNHNEMEIANFLQKSLCNLHH